MTEKLDLEKLLCYLGESKREECKDVQEYKQKLDEAHNYLIACLRELRLYDMDQLPRPEGLKLSELVKAWGFKNINHFAELANCEVLTRRNLTNWYACPKRRELIKLLLIGCKVRLIQSSSV